MALAMLALILAAPSAQARTEANLRGAGTTLVDLPDGSDGDADAQPANTGPTVRYQEASCLDLGGAGCRAQWCGFNPPKQWYDKYVDGQLAGRECLSEGEAQQGSSRPVITLAMVQRAFERLRWPSATLTVQPPDNRTLVGMPAVFSTTQRGARQQTVTLLGQAVTIEARIDRYTWHAAGAELPEWTTLHPGQWRQHGVDPSSLVHADYTRPGAYTASVDLTYRGRFRVGPGPWQTIPQPLTVAGPSESIRVLEAVPLLTAPDG